MIKNRHFKINNLKVKLLRGKGGRGRSNPDSLVYVYIYIFLYNSTLPLNVTFSNKNVFQIKRADG